MSPSIAYRRCHVCGAVCEHAGEITRCDQCRKPFAPFYYYDDREAPTLSATELRPAPSVWGPIRGLTAYWGTD